MRKFSPENGKIYHIFNRGVEKRQIFTGKKDYERFVINLILFNTINEPFSNVGRYNIQEAYRKISDQNIVKIHAFALLPNHFHFMLEQVESGGISKFMHRIEMGYSRYFNILYERSGHLFQGNYKLASVDRDEYLLYLPLYIHLNPLELLPSEKDWKERGVRNQKKALDFLKKYPWSSLGEYVGVNHLPFIEKGIVNDFYQDSKDWEREIQGWTSGREEIFRDCA